MSILNYKKTYYIYHPWEVVSELWHWLTCGIHNVTRGIHNMIRWTPIIWRDADWDWTYLIRILEFKLTSMSKCMEHGYHVNGKKDARDLRVASALCKRIREDRYDESIENTEYQAFCPRRKDSAASDITWYALFMMKSDIEYLTKLINKRLLYWWD